MSEATLWLGEVPSRCQCCKRTIGLVFFDKRTPRGGWALMCPKCAHKIDGGKTGVGIGQRYKLNNEHRWAKCGAKA